MRLKSNTKIVIAFVASVLVAVALVGVLGNSLGLFSKGLDEVTLRERNEKNLIQSWTETDYNNGDGVTAKFKDDGRVVLGGQNKTSNNIKIEYAKLNLVPGTYSLWGAENGGNSTYHIRAEWTDSEGAKTAVSDFNNNTVKIVNDGNTSVEVTLYIFVGVDAYVNNVTVKPVLCSGTEKVSFYA